MTHVVGVGIPQDLFIEVLPMTIPKAPTHTTIRTSGGKEFKKPIPWRVQREMELAAALDGLLFALAKARADVATITSRNEAGQSAPPEVATLLAAIRQLDSAGEDVCTAIKTLLVL
jgi:hypothetical protein